MVIGIRETGADGPRRGRAAAVVVTLLNGLALAALLFVTFVAVFAGPM